MTRIKSKNLEILQHPGASGNGSPGEKFGSKWILNLAIFGGAICSLLSPLVVKNLGLWGYVSLRIIQGLLQGPTSPLGFTILAKWLPVKGGLISESV